MCKNTEQIFDQTKLTFLVFFFKLIFYSPFPFKSTEPTHTMILSLKVIQLMYTCIQYKVDCMCMNHYITETFIIYRDTIRSGGTRRSLLG